MEEEEEEEEAYCCIVSGVPKQFFRRKVERLLRRHVAADLWRIERFIPLEQDYQLHIVCRTAAARERVELLKSAMPQFTMQMVAADVAYPLPGAAASAERPSLMQLNVDCLRHIIGLCSLKDQLAWAKVSHSCLEIVSDIWRHRYKTLRFDMQELECHHGLNAEQLGDFCALIGDGVERLIYSSILYFPLIQRHLSDMPGNLMVNAKRYVNLRFCQLLGHFPHLSIVEVAGKFLADFTVRELARHCGELRVLRLLDTGNRWLHGSYLHHFRHLQELDLRNCEFLGRRQLRRVCMANPALQRLNVIECLGLYRSAYFSRLCGQLNQLTHLEMSAIADGPMIQAILDLPALKAVRFYWTTDPDFVYFEYMLLAIMQQNHRSTAHLCALEFHNERIFLDNASQERLSAYKYVEMRERLALRSSPWRWEGTRFTRMAEALAAMQALELLRCQYCRIFGKAQLLHLRTVCPHLRLIEYVGCREASDSDLQQAWCVRDVEDGQNDACQLSLVDGLPLPALQLIRDKLGQRTHIVETALRSIECRFN